MHTYQQAAVIKVLMFIETSTRFTLDVAAVISEESFACDFEVKVYFGIGAN